MMKLHHLQETTMLHDALQPYRYLWPRTDLITEPGWDSSNDPLFIERHLPESDTELAADSRWPGFFPSPLCIVTACDGTTVALEKVVGASIVNRFPYVVALSFCTKQLSSRHYARERFTETLERGGQAAIQFVQPGPDLERIMRSIAEAPDEQTTERIRLSGLSTRSAITNSAPVFDASYLVYEARLVRPSTDFEGRPIYAHPWTDVGSHRVYFLEINALQLRTDIAQGRSQILWQSLPTWQPQQPASFLEAARRNGNNARQCNARYQKGYTPHYAFPSAGTVAFEHDQIENGMAIKHLPPLAEDQVEVDNDRARWPCFFPSSAGMITTWTSDGRPNLMPCGSTTVISRHPLMVAPCISYTRINERYARRASLEMVRRAGRFVCGVPYISETVLNAIRYAGNTSFADDPEKVANAELHVRDGKYGPLLAELPVHFECEVVDEVALGTHIMFFGEVRRVVVRRDVSAANPLVWCPWAVVAPWSSQKSDDVSSGHDLRPQTILN